MLTLALRPTAAIHAPAALREAHLDPVGGAIATPVIAGLIDQSFQQHRLCAISGPPVARQLARRPGEDMAGQVRHPDPRQNQKAAVIDRLRQVRLAGGGAPTDVGIPRRHLPSGAGEQQASQHRTGRLGARMK